MNVDNEIRKNILRKWNRPIYIFINKNEIAQNIKIKARSGGCSGGVIR